MADVSQEDIETRWDQWQMNIEPGIIKDEKCNRNGCNGVIIEHETDTSCSCHINPPCSHCTEDRNYCPVCGWEGADDYIEPVVTDTQKEYYKKQNEELAVQKDLFYKKYRGEIPADKLEIRSESHTHFSMKKIGVFAKGTETQLTLLPKVTGTFGGRFEIFNDFSFSFIAYTD